VSREWERETSPASYCYYTTSIKFMNWIKKVNGDILFIIMAVLYFDTRIPRGDTLQTVVDALVVVALVLIVLKNLLVRFK